MKLKAGVKLKKGIKLKPEAKANEPKQYPKTSRRYYASKSKKLA